MPGSVVGGTRAPRKRRRRSLRDHAHVRVTFCGVRGSTPSPGNEFVRYGGHTACVAVAHDGASPTLVVDAGTGLRRLDRVLGGEPFRGTIVLGHLHLDHIIGLPFFAAPRHPDSHTQVLVPGAGDAADALAGALGPPHFPVRPDELSGSWEFRSIEPGDHQLEGFSVTALEIPHNDARTYGFRVSDGSAIVAYLSDHSPLSLGPGPDGHGAYHDAALRLVRGVDLLVHDSQHLAVEFPAKAFLGHSTVEYVIGLAQEAGARQVALYHHDFDRTDDQIDAIAARCPSHVQAAFEGLVMDLPSH